MNVEKENELDKLERTVVMKRWRDSKVGDRSHGDRGHNRMMMMMMIRKVIVHTYTHIHTHRDYYSQAMLLIYIYLV